MSESSVLSKSSESSELQIFYTKVLWPMLQNQSTWLKSESDSHTHPSLIHWSNWRSGGPDRWHLFLESTTPSEWKSRKKAGLRSWPFLLEGVTRLRPLGIGPNFFWAAAVLNKNQMSHYELKWFLIEKMEKAMIFCTQRPKRSVISP